MTTTTYTTLAEALADGMVLWVQPTGRTGWVREAGQCGDVLARAAVRAGITMAGVERALLAGDTIFYGSDWYQTAMLRRPRTAAPVTAAVASVAVCTSCGGPVADGGARCGEC